MAIRKVRSLRTRIKAPNHIWRRPGSTTPWIVAETDSILPLNLDDHFQLGLPEDPSRAYKYVMLGVRVKVWSYDMETGELALTLIADRPETP